MECYNVEFASRVRKDFRKIPQQDADRILARIKALEEDPRPRGSKRLKGEDLYRIRLGNYRVVYEIEDAALLVLVVRVGDRKNVYSG